MGIGMRSGRSRMALLVAVRDGARLPVSMPAVGAGAGTIVGGGWWSGNFGGEGGSLGGDLLGGGGRGDGGPDDGEGEAEPDGDADLGAEAQRGTAAPAAQERGGGAAGRAAGHRHAAAGGGPVSWWGRVCRCEWLAWTLGGGAVEGWRLGEAKRRSSGSGGSWELGQDWGSGEQSSSSRTCRLFFAITSFFLLLLLCWPVITAVIFFH